MSFFTPLRYPGGKGQLASWLATVLDHNELKGGTYVEPYAGGCGAGIHLLLTEQVGRIIINDADPAIYAFWWCVLNDFERLQERILRCKISLSARERHKQIICAPEAHSLADVGFATLFMNRTSRSGILSGGVIGGKDQTGPYKIDARFNRQDLASRVAKIAAKRSRISLYGLDAIELLKKIKRRISSKTLIYFDPPYFVKGSQLYRNHYLPEDHAKIAATVKEIRTPWLVTYDDCAPIRALYKDCAKLKYMPYYSTHTSRAKAREIMFYENIEVPSAPYLRRAAPNMQLG